MSHLIVGRAGYVAEMLVANRASCCTLADPLYFNLPTFKNLDKQGTPR